MHIAREKRGGGVDVLYRANLIVNNVTESSYSTLEIMHLIVCAQKRLFRIDIVYRPERFNKNNLKFIEEFSDTCFANKRYYFRGRHQPSFRKKSPKLTL